MSYTITRFWNEQDGAIVSAELMLVATILVVGVLVGLKSLRDSVVTELADVGQAVSNINQSFSFSGTSGNATFGGGSSNGNSYGMNNNMSSSKCVSVCDAAVSES